MHIVMGTHFTVISVDESKINTYNLFSFIKTQFPLHHFQRNALFLNYSPEHHFKHLFLIKWIYSIHKKVNRWESLKLREVLIDRIEKPIKIITKRAIEEKSTLSLEICEKNRLRLSLKQKNYRLFGELQNRFHEGIQIISYLNRYFEISTKDENIKNQIRQLLMEERIAGTVIFIRYNPLDLASLFEEKKENDKSLYSAFKNLQSDPDEPIEIIKKRYKKLLIRYHPDNVFQEGAEKINEYTEIFKNLQVSFEIVQSHRY